MALDSALPFWQYTWGIWSLVVLGSFLLLEIYAVLSHGWTLSNTVAYLTTNHPWMLVVYVSGVVVLGLHIWLFGGK